MTREEAIDRMKRLNLNSVDREALYTIIPELRESDDERMAEMAIKAVLSPEAQSCIKSWGVNPDDVIAWLKKQKELSTDYFSTDHIETFPDGMTVRYTIGYLEKQKEHKRYWKPTETDVALFNKAVITNNVLTPTERAQLDIIRSKFGYCRAVNCSGIVQEDQKLETFNEPYNPDDYEVVMEGNAINLNRKEQKSVDYDHEMWKNCEANFEGGKKEVIEHPEKYGLQKPAEWNEEDEKIRKQLINICDEWIGGYSARPCLNDVRWLKNLLEKQKEPTLAEWSEEDEKMLDATIDIVSGSFYEPLCPRKEMLAWLKSIRPSWKPSKEQMEAFRSVLEHEAERVGSSKYLEKANSLYEQLKKL